MAVGSIPHSWIRSTGTRKWDECRQDVRNPSVDLGHETNCHGTYNSESACTPGMNIVNSCYLYPDCPLTHHFFNFQEYPTLWGVHGMWYPTPSLRNVWMGSSCFRESRGPGCPLDHQMARNQSGMAIWIVPQGHVLWWPWWSHWQCPLKVWTGTEPWAHDSCSLIFAVVPASKLHIGSCLISKADPTASVMNLSAILQLVGVILLFTIKKPDQYKCHGLFPTQKL